jgi:hypothetical protein
MTQSSTIGCWCAAFANRFSCPDHESNASLRCGHAFHGGGGGGGQDELMKAANLVADHKLCGLILIAASTTIRGAVFAAVGVPAAVTFTAPEAPRNCIPASSSTTRRGVRAVES